ncbi:MAG TPA: GrpB family protein [Solirubrobacteraceae bacterium]|nr:GrpB family protein [Solirubrobacteraceae bacterium]
MDARLAAYHPGWPDLYEQEVAGLIAALAPALAAEHVGSTFVPGLAGW